MADRALRTGGLPLLPSGAAWPTCGRCGMPMLFRAQVPLAVTSLVGVDDPRLLAVFECYAEGEHGPCDGGAVLVVDQEDVEIAEAPAPEAHDVVLLDLGRSPSRVWEVIENLVSDSRESVDDLAPPPVTLVPASPLSIAEQVVSVVEEVGGVAVLRPTPVTRLRAVWGGRLVPFEDGFPGTRRTTLPPLSNIMKAQGRPRVMRGLFGGMTPGYRDHPTPCTCGRPTRTAVRLLGQRKPDETGVRLGPATVQVCLPCSRATLHRVLAG